MNKYQKELINSSKININNSEAKIVISEDSFIINQSENAYIEEYNIIINNPAVSKIEIDNDSINNSDGYHFVLDFKKRKETITFHFNDNLADKLSLKLVYNEKSKEDWDEKNKVNRWKELEPRAQIKVSTGVDLVNIYFQPCSDDYSKTVIELYTAKGKWSEHPRVIGRGQTFVPSLLSATIENLMAKFTIEEGVYFKSITGLAFGAYGFKLSQFSKDDDLLFTSDYQYFAIQKK
jgi:hypothetical protein